MKIKEQTRKLAAGCYCFEVVDGTDVVEIVDKTDEVSEVVDKLTKSVTIYTARRR
ncbi:chlorohydrolase [Streptococcus pneumoniae]|nr:chlorohydrolase [Streptococcus pneumoniae]